LPEVVTVPVSLTAFPGEGNHHVEFGAGVTWAATEEFFGVSLGTAWR